MHELFIKKYFLKKDEVIEKVELDGNVNLVLVMKKKARTFKKVAQYKITANPIQITNEIPVELKKYKFTPKVKRKIIESNEMIQHWLNEGWIVREIRYNPDGISVKEDNYRIGPTYLTTLERMEEKRKELIENQLETLYKKAEKIKLPYNFQKLIKWDNLPSIWSTSKRIKFIEFCLAFYELSMQKELFDFKEIGATLHDTIGGSKYFDNEREVFLDHLEKNEIDVSYYGLVSIGKIVPIFFTGNIQNAFSTYLIGSVHATTDNAVLLSPFTTTNTTMWLVENRAILTRMAIEIEFLKESNSCIICLDGQIRSAHKKFIEQLLQSNVKKTIIWTDTDEAGVSIAKHAVELINGPVKIVGHNLKLYDSIEQFAEAHKNQIHEQEQQLGGVKDWMKWV